MDVNQGTAVLSGDLILDTLAKELKPKVCFSSFIDLFLF